MSACISEGRRTAVVSSIRRGKSKLLEPHKNGVITLAPDLRLSNGQDFTVYCEAT